MVGPVAKAQPAELAAALAAHHVHAPLVLLYGPLALGAGLGVGQNPVGVLTLCTVLPQPHAHSHAVHLRATHHTSHPSQAGPEWGVLSKRSKWILVSAEW